MNDLEACTIQTQWGATLKDEALKKAKNKKWMIWFSVIAAIIVLPAIFGTSESEKLEALKTQDPEAYRKTIDDRRAKEAAATTKKAEEKRQGFHCLSGWDGSHRAVNRYVEKRLRDPDSFEHIETRISPVKNGKHTLIMSYRAINGFGGKTVGKAVATIQNDDCSATVTAMD